MQSGTKKPIGKTLLFGALSAAFYAAVFSYADLIAVYFSKGSLWAAGPIATVFVVSYIYGNFTSNLWTCLGVEAKRVQKRVEKPAEVRPQMRATLHAE